MSTSTFQEVVNPFTMQTIGSVPLRSWEEIDSYLAEAAQLHKQHRRGLAAHQRIKILGKAAAAMEARTQELAFQIANEGGKPLADARTEVERAINTVNLSLAEISQLKGEEIPMDLTAAGAGRMSFSTREPVGPVVAISAFNHPLNLIAHQVAPAIAVGCPVLVKPSSETPLSCRTFIEILHEAGLPEAWCRFVPCEEKLAQRMATDARVAHVSFVGSAKVGWELRSKLAPGTRCSLEHGGAAPVIVGKTANLDKVIPALVKGGFYHSGQVCVSVQRVFVAKEMAEKFAKALALEAEKLVVGNATQEKTDCGPLIRPAEVKRLEKWVKEARDGGAEIYCGGKAIGETCYAPTVLLNPPLDAQVSTEEIFGPVICVYSYAELKEALEKANATKYAFQAAVFTEHLPTAMHLVKQLDATTVMVNDHSAFRVDWMPFAGRRQSGLGVGGVASTMQELTQAKVAVIKL